MQINCSLGVIFVLFKPQIYLNWLVLSFWRTTWSQVSILLPKQWNQVNPFTSSFLTSERCLVTEALTSARGHSWTWIKSPVLLWVLQWHWPARGGVLLCMSGPRMCQTEAPASGCAHQLCLCEATAMAALFADGHWHCVVQWGGRSGLM